MSGSISKEPFQLTNRREARDHLHVYMDAHGRVFIEIEIDTSDEGAARMVTFYLSKPMMRALRDELSFYLKTNP